MNCLGCGIDTGWIKGTVMAYTCYCGATVFHEEGHLVLPVSFYRCLIEGHAFPHIDYYVGKSARTSPEKESFIVLLKGYGAVWSWECPECRQGVLERSKMEVENHLYRLPLHPELQRILKDISIHGG